MSPAADIAFKCSRCSAAVIDMAGAVCVFVSGDAACPRRLATSITTPVMTATNKAILINRTISVLLGPYFFDPALRFLMTPFFFATAFLFGAAFFFLAAAFFLGAAFFFGAAFVFFAAFGFGAAAAGVECSANAAPCGSAPIVIHPPPGTCAGPWKIVAPSDFALSVAAFTSATLMYGSHADGRGGSGGFVYIPPTASFDPSGA